MVYCNVAEIRVGFSTIATTKEHFALSKLLIYSELSLRRTPSGPAPAVRLMEVSAFNKENLVRNKQWNSAGKSHADQFALERCPPYTGVRFEL